MDKFELPVSGGRPSDLSSKEISISTHQGNLVRSPYDGVVQSVDVNDCGGNVKIKHIVGNDVYHSNICEVNRITVNKGDNLRKGSSLGIAGNKDLRYSILDNRNQKVRLKPFFEGIDSGTSKDEKKKEKEDGKKKEDSLDTSQIGLPTDGSFHDTFLKTMLFPFTAADKAFGKNFKPVMENKILQEEVNRIKQLLK